MFFRSGKKSAQDISLNEPIDTDQDGNTLTILDTMAVDGTIIEEIDTRMKSERLYGLVRSVLTPRERTIICLRYGLEGCRPQPQRVVAQRLGISRSYVSRIEKRALQKGCAALFEAAAPSGAGTVRNPPRRVRSPPAAARPGHIRTPRSAFERSLPKACSAGS